MHPYSSLSEKGKEKVSQESSRGWNGYFLALIFLLHLYYLLTCCSLYDTLYFHSFIRMPSLLLCFLIVCYSIGLYFIITRGTLTSWKWSSCVKTLHTQPASMHAQSVNTLLWLMHKESHTHCREQWEKCCRLRVKHMRTLCLKHESPRKMQTTTGPNVQHYPGPGTCVIVLSIIVCVCRVSAFAHVWLPAFLHMPQLDYVVAFPVSRQFQVWGMPPTFIHLHSCFIIATMLCPHTQKTTTQDYGLF